MKIRPRPCATCPYRKDVASGVWDASEYAKLLDYDGETHSQLAALFMCHAGPDQCCSGWATCHSSRGGEFALLALRISRVGAVPEHEVEVFESAREACDHGMREIDSPSFRAYQAMDKVKQLRARRETLTDSTIRG